MVYWLTPRVRKNTKNIYIWYRRRYETIGSMSR
jgi:hypothetical protein